jgi:hypothetical protein
MVGEGERKGIPNTPIITKTMTVSEFLDQALIGLLLGDLTIRKHVSAIGGYNLQFQHCLAQLTYMEHLHSLFTDFVVAPIKTGSTFDHRTQTSYQWCVFATLSFVCFAYYRNLFYDPAGKKIVPSNIGELLTAVGLAYWICDDGHFHNPAKQS